MTAPTGLQTDRLIADLAARGLLGDQEATRAAPATSEQHRQRILKAIGHGRDQGKQPPRSRKSRDWTLPLELRDIEGAECHCGAVSWTAQDGRITPRYRPGKKKGCAVCGRRLRARYWLGYGPILDAADRLARGEIPEQAWPKLRRRLTKDGYWALPIPVEGGRIVYTTAPLDWLPPSLGFGDVARSRRPAQLAADLLAMTDDARRMKATGTWHEQWEAFKAAEEEARPAPTGEHVGISGPGSIPVARLEAQRFGILLEDDGGQLLVIRDIRDSDPGTWAMFAHRVGIHKWAAKGEEAKAA
jgi:hypothetical protein